MCCAPLIINIDEIETMVKKILISSRRHINSEGVFLRLSQEPDLHVAEWICEERLLEKSYTAHKPSIVLMCDTFSDSHTVQLIRRFNGDYPDAKIIITSNTVERQLIMDFMASGAKGFIAARYADFDELFAAIRAVGVGNTYLCQKTTEMLLGGIFNRNTLNHDEPLSERERQVIRLISDGKSSKEIARILDISPRTVEVHRRNMMRKIGVHKTAELTRYAIRSELASV